MDYVAAVRAQRTFFLSGATRPLSFRRDQLRKLRQAIELHEATLLAALHSDLRKSAAEAYTTEIGLVLSEIRHAERNLARWVKPQARPLPPLAWPGRGFVHPEPYGAALIIGPWNYPFQLLLAPLVGAIASGCCAILKPSEFAPRTAEAIARMLGSAFPPDYIAVVPGERDIAERLLGERFDVIFFTGSTSVGRAVMSAAARHLTPITLELGGKSPCIVCRDAPLDITARRIVWGKFLNVGQTCVAPDFVLVDRLVRDGLLEAMQRAVRAFYGPDPRQSPDYSRIVNLRHLNRLADYLQCGRIVCGGQRDPDDLYLAPTILADVAWEATIMQDEIFGPVLPVLEFSDLDEALARLRIRPVPLALYLFTGVRAIQDRVLAATRSGGVCINDTVVHLTGKQLPFGGLGDSGLGAYHGRASFDAFSHRRSVVRRRFRWDPRDRYPPARVRLTTLKRLYGFLLGR